MPDPFQKSYPARADVVIIGAGITGASIAWNLARDSGLDVLVLDSGPKAGGSTSRSAAAFRHQFSSASAIEMSLISGREYRDFSKTFGCEEVFTRNGYLFLWSRAEDADAAASRVDFQRERGVPDVEMLGADAVRRKFPWVDHPELKGASWCPHDGFLKPDLVASTYLEAAVKRGRTLLQYSEVTGIEVAGGAVRSVTVLGRHRIETGTVVNAAGPWANAVSQLAGVQIPLTPVKRYLYFTNQLPGEGVPGWPLTVLDLEVYGRPEHDGLMMGWDLRPAKPSGWDRFPPPTLDAASLNDRIEPGFGIGPDDYGFEVLSRMAEWIPVVAEKAGLDHASCGYYEVTPDEKAIVSWDPRVRGLLHAAGFSGHGVMHAPATGRLVADMILGRPAPIDLKALSLDPLLRNEERDDPERMVI
ncbi:MAG: FAD-binding oxidoreductase [Candidatus Brocadiae bacterium]|nr:FAD-binding oxidoreductase [Candidatus Brocadiia bacterium]